MKENQQLCYSYNYGQISMFSDKRNELFYCFFFHEMIGNGLFNQTSSFFFGRKVLHHSKKKKNTKKQSGW